MKRKKPRKRRQLVPERRPRTRDPVKSKIENGPMSFSPKIEVQTINHLGLIAGIIDDIGIEEMINEVIGFDNRELVTAGQVVKAIILNGLGFVSQPLYLFPQFFENKATEHLLGKGIEAKHLNDDKIGRVMDKLYEKGLSSIFLLIALAVVKKYQILTNFSPE